MVPHVRNQGIPVQIKVEDVVLSSARGVRRPAREENALHP